MSDSLPPFSKSLARERQPTLIVNNDTSSTASASSGGQPRASSTVVIDVGGPDPDFDPNPLPGQTPVNPVGPTLFILVHGMSHPALGDPRFIDTPQQSHKEWHLDFIQGLLGGRDPGGGDHLLMFNFAGQSINQATFMGPWFKANGEVVPNPNLQDPGLLPRFDSFTNEVDIENLDAVASHFITLDDVGDVRQGLQAGGIVPQLSAFITYRDATAGLVESGKRIANETYVAIRWYELHFRLTPKVVYVAQSFGGLAARFVLSKPTQTQLDAPGPPNSQPMNPDGIQLDDEDARRMDYVRDRIVYMVTLGTPHEGSYLADLLVPLQHILQSLENSLDNGVAGLEARWRPLGALLAAIDDLGAALNPPTQTPAETLAIVRQALAELRGRLNGRAFRDLRHPFWVRVNKGPLHPKLARRTSASPIPGASGQLIPIYAAGARTPGGLAFTSPELAVIERLHAQNRQEQEWMIDTVVTDLLIHTLREGQSGFGRADQGIYAGFQAQLDRRERIVDASVTAKAAAAAIANKVSPWFAEEFGAAVEGIVKFVMGGTRLIALPIYLARKGRFDLGASVVLRVPAFQCSLANGTQFSITLTYGRLLKAMRATFGSLTAARNALKHKDLNGVLGALALAAGNADRVIQWFTEQYDALNVPAGRCRLGNLASPLSAVNILNWKVVNATDTFPAPRWVVGTQLASDGEIDNDGVVSFDSAVGFSLGTSTPLFFDHTHITDVFGVTRGSWYRIFDSPVERECHGMQHQWNIGNWTLKNFATAGPVPGPGAFSVYP
jgi:hypothetical protein